MKYFASRISDNLHKTPEGYLLAMAVPIGRVGEMEYGRGETPLEVGDDNIVYVSRDAEELFKPETMASFNGKPLTIRHPSSFVDSSNWKDLAKGTIQNVRQGQGSQKTDLIADILITDQMAISLVENGMRQLSCGYEAEYLQTGPGTGKQKNIVGNHLALVEEGRAGDAYKINDEKGVPSMNKKLEAALKRLFGKTSDQIMAEADEKAAAEKAAAAKKAKAKDNKGAGYDELVAMCADLMAKVEKLGQPQDEEKPEEKKEEKEAAKDEEVAPALEDRLKALEAVVQKLLERESAEESVAVDEEEEEEVVVDEDGDDGDEEVEDEDSEEEPKLTGDEKSKLEILAPGAVPTRDFKRDALKSAYKTADGKKHIDALTGGKPTFDSAEQVSILFNAVPEMLKGSRSGSLARTKTKDFNSSIFQSEESGEMTAEKINELNQKHYNQKK